MIICKSRNFLFCRGLKQAGTSVKAALSTLCNAEDTISHYMPSEEAILKSKGYIIHQHNIARDGKTVLIPSYRHWSLVDIYRERPRYCKLDVVGLCRNPYDKLYSFGKWFLFCQHYKRHGEKVFKEISVNKIRKVINSFAENVYRRTDALASYDYLINLKTKGQVYLLRFENLEYDLSEFFKRFGLSLPKLFHFKDTTNVCTLPWNEVLTSEEIALANRIFRKDFEIFGYERVSP